MKSIIKVINCLLLITIFFLSPQKVLTQNRFQNLTMKDGLSTNYIHCCLKDSRGFIWFATDNGICRYDGIRFKIFNGGSNRYPELKENIFESVYEISTGELLFISFNNKLFTYNYKSGKFTSLGEKLLYLKNKSVTSYYRDSNKNYWLSTDSGLLKVDDKFNLITEYIINEPITDNQENNLVKKIFEDKTGMFWLGMYNKTLMRFNPVTGKFSRKELSKIIPPLQQVNAIVGTNNLDYVYVGTGGEGLLKINIHDLSFEKWKFISGSNNSLPSDRITALSMQNDSILWVGTLDGLSQLNINTKKINNFYHDPQNPFSLINNYITHLYIGEQDILWVSTFGGVSKFYTFPDRFVKVSQNYNYSSTLSSNIVNHCIKDKFGNLWIATSKGIDVKEAKGSKYFHYNIPKSFKYHKTEEIIKFFIDDDTWWIGTWGGGLSRFILTKDFKPGSPIKFKNFYNIPNDSTSLSSNFIRSFAKDRIGNLWITTWSGGLNKINSDDKNKDEIIFTRFTDKGNPLQSVASNYIEKLIFDSDNILWLCTSKGIQRFDTAKNHFEMFYVNPENPNDKINFGNNIIEDENKNFWVSGFDGLIKIVSDGKGGFSSKIIYRNGLHGIYSMTMDKNGIIWFSTLFSEIGSFNRKSNELKFYSMIEEVDGFDFYLGEPFVDKLGKIYFCGNSGYLMFHPDYMPENKFVPPIYITSIKIAGEEYVGNTDIINIKEIELEYDQRNILIEFAALNFVYSYKNEYKYTLDGFDKNWNSTGNKTEINYANIPTGKYTLRIIGSNNDGYWNTAGISLIITVNPPFWETVYFRFIILITFGITLFLIVNSKIKRLQTEKHKQNLFSKLLIKSQEDERKKLAQELHDSLGQNLLVIKNQIDMFKTSDQKELNELDNISNLVKESISEVKEISSNLHPHQLERLGLNKALNALIKKISSASNLEIEANLDDISGVWNIEKEINVFRIVQESLNNIVKHSGSHKAKIEIRKEPCQIFITIEDYGKGFDFADKDLQNNFIEGLGLKNISERVNILNGKLNITSAHGIGTKIFITIRIDK